MIERTADANWKGRFKDGHGLTTTESKVLTERRFSYKSRFGDGDVGKSTNPEELIAAAAASCYSMALAKKLSDSGNEPVELHVRATITVDESEGPFISKLLLKVEGFVPGISPEDFSEAAEETMDECPVVQLLSPGLDETELEADLQP